jgi:hypothetical protein
MIKLISKCVLVAAVASFALAGATTMSHAAKKKAAKPAPVASCVAPKYAKAACANGLCRMQWCGVDGKWYPSLMACWEPFCPKG